MKLTPEQFTVFLVSLSLMLLTARMLGEGFAKIKQAPIIGEILAGILLGPTVLGTLFPRFSAWVFPRIPEIQYTLDGITTLAVVMLLLVYGLEVDISVILRLGKTASLTSLFGVVIPFAFGFSLAYLFPRYLGLAENGERLVFSLFIGTSMAISALPVIARTLMDLNIFKSDVGLIIVASAMFDDLAGWIIFSIILGMMGGPVHGLGAGERIIVIFAFIGFMLLVVRRVLNRIIPYVQKNATFPGGILTFVFVLAFLCAALTEAIGIHAIFGAFILGVTIGDTTHLKERTREIVHQFVTNIFAPLFFVSIGLRVNFIANFDLSLVMVIVAIASLGKLLGCGLGARLGGMGRAEALAIGFGMNSRGAMEIILGLLALQHGLIEEKVFVALVIMALVTSLASPPVMNFLLRRRERVSLLQLLSPPVVTFSNASTKAESIQELAGLIADRHKLDRELIASEVMKQEASVPSGIGNHLAIPHAKLNIAKPVAGVAINHAGVDFEAPDGLPAEIILMLLTPADNVKVQFQYLAEIAARFETQEKVGRLLKAGSAEEFLKLLGTEG
ncbi:MAG: putative Na/H antiporter [Bacteroidetes bacterium]|jgi:Kef-type K+ transport system membrane component KefB/mannitol/fructose-specific phosphotransferase system IIA component (Ntr-type)|nr:putative Na/H antiporter [Bacteroidota bacterium]